MQQRPSAGGLAKAQEAVWVKELPPPEPSNTIGGSRFSFSSDEKPSRNTFHASLLPPVSFRGRTSFQPKFGQADRCEGSVCVLDTELLVNTPLTVKEGIGQYGAIGQMPLQSTTNEMTAKEMAPPPSVSTRSCSVCDATLCTSWSFRPACFMSTMCDIKDLKSGCYISTPSRTTLISERCQLMALPGNSKHSSP